MTQTGSYNFDEVIDRNNSQSVKWDGRGLFFPEQPDAIPLWIADLDLPCPDEIVQAIRQRAAHPIYGYTYPDEELKRLIAAWQKKRNRWEITPDSISFANGVISAISTIIQTFTAPGEGIIIQPPVYHPFRECISSNERMVENNPLIYHDGKWSMDYRGFEELAAKPSSKLFLLCNPHNPVGRVFSRTELEKIASICLKHDLYIVSDEIHSDIIYDHARHLPVAAVDQSFSGITFTVFSPSKTFNIAGMQTSVVVSENPELLEQFNKEMKKSAFIMNLFGAVAMKAAYSGCEDYLNQLLDYLWQNYLYVDRFLNKQMPLIKCQKPEATYLLWLDCRALGLNSRELSDFFLKKARVILDSGRWFGEDGRGFMRLNIGCPRATLEKAMLRIKRAYDRAAYQGSKA